MIHTSPSRRARPARLAAGAAALCVTLLSASGCQTRAPVEEACPTPPATDARPWLDPSYEPHCRAGYVLASMESLEERLAFLDGGGFGGSPQLEAYGLRLGATSDGPAGYNGGVAWPTPLALAASFDPELAERLGVVMGGAFHESGRNGILGPAMDVARTWRFGRATESYGEDPYLSARIAAREIAGLQSQHVLTTIKHFAVYTQEQGRLGDNPLGERPALDQIVSERAMREIYLPPFRAAIVEGRAGGVMCSFPRVNGVYACEHDALLTDILKDEWGFDGAVYPDFPVAQRSIADAFLAGLDAGVMSPEVVGGGSASAGRFAGELSLREAVARGLVPESRIDDMVLRRLTPGFRIGTFDNPAYEVPEAPSMREALTLAADIIQSGSVLLKNDGALPIAPSVSRIAVVGTQAGDGAYLVEQGSAHVEPNHLVSALDGLRARVGADVEIIHEPGDIGLGPLPAFAAGRLTTPDGAPGLLAEYFPSSDIRAFDAPFASRIEAGVDLNGLPEIDGLPAGKAWSIRWRGTFTPRASGSHLLRLHGSGAAELWVGEELHDGFANADFGAFAEARVDLIAGEPVAIEVRYSPRVTLGDGVREQFGTVLGPVLRLGHAPPDDRVARAARAAAEADVAIVVAGHIVGEGADRHTLALPGAQDELVAAVAAANPNTVVVLTTGGPVAMPWLDDVGAVLQAWLPGDAFGTALVGLLLGDADPGGRLPVTYPADESQGPGATPETYPGTLTEDGALDTVHLDEGLAIGYRYWDVAGQTPLFPFGHGLSYARFDIEDLGVTARADGGADVRVRVSNVSERSGVEVVQVYLGFPRSAGGPPAQLRGFAKVSLDPGDTRELTIALDAHAFEIWDADADRWRTPRGAFEVMVARSSRDVVHRATMRPLR